MENGLLTLGLEDGTIDVECLLVEPQDELVSMDSVICFTEKIPENAMDMEEVSRSFGWSDIGTTSEGNDIFNGEALDAMPSEDQVRYFQLQNDFCSMGEEYLLGVEFAESITNLDYGSSERLQTSVADNIILESCVGLETPWKSDLFRLMDLPGCQRNVGRSEAIDIPKLLESATLAMEKPLRSLASCTLQSTGKSHDIPCCSFQEVLSDENDGSLSTSTEMLCSSKIEKYDELGLKCKNTGMSKFWGTDAVATNSSPGNHTDALPTQKRSRKPTQRYIDELEDPISRHSKRRREVSSPTIKDKSVGVKDQKKCNKGSRAMTPAVESSVTAIQVPFGSLVHTECPKSHRNDTVRGTEPKDIYVTPKNQKKRDDCMTQFHLKKRDDCVTASQRKRDDDVTAAYLKKRKDPGTGQRKRDNCGIDVNPKERNDPAASVIQKKRDHRFREVRNKKRDDCQIAESPEEVNGHRKHHRLWTITEVKKLIDGVSQCGVGRWSQIKKLFFSTSAHRTSVDLKDKWRNLLKASGIVERGNHPGEKKHNAAWRPLPKSILRRVCELAAVYPYPKGQNSKIAHSDHDSPVRSTDTTLNDYSRSLQSINRN